MFDVKYNILKTKYFKMTIIDYIWNIRNSKKNRLYWNDK
jgi:hypothetical protein